MHGELANSNKKPTDKFVVELSDMVKKEGFFSRSYLTQMRQGYFGRRYQVEPNI